MGGTWIAEAQSLIWSDGILYFHSEQKAKMRQIFRAAYKGGLAPFYKTFESLITVNTVHKVGVPLRVRELSVEGPEKIFKNKNKSNKCWCYFI